MSSYSLGCGAPLNKVDNEGSKLRDQASSWGLILVNPSPACRPLVHERSKLFCSEHAASAL